MFYGAFKFYGAGVRPWRRMTSAMAAGLGGAGGVDVAAALAMAAISRNVMVESNVGQPAKV